VLASISPTSLAISTP